MNSIENKIGSDNGFLVENPPLSSSIPTEQQIAVQQLAQQILEKENLDDFPDLERIVTDLTRTGNELHLTYLQGYLQHFHRVQGENFGRAFLKIIKVYEDRGTILGSLKTAIYEWTSAENLPFLEKIAEDEEFLRAWFRFSYGLPSSFDIKKVNIELFKKFLKSKLGMVNQVSIRASYEDDCITINWPYFFCENQQTHKVQIKNLKALEILFDDPDFLEMAIDFSKSYPSYLPYLFSFIELIPEKMKEWLQACLVSSARSDFLAIFTFTIYFNISDIFKHPALSDEKITQLKQHIQSYPLLGSDLIALTLYEWDHPQLDGLMMTLFKEKTYTPFLLDFILSLRMQTQNSSWNLKTPLDTFANLKDLLDCSATNLVPFLRQISDLSALQKEKVIHQLHALNQSSPDLLQRVLSQTSSTVLMILLGRFFSTEVVNTQRIIGLLDWIDTYPNEMKFFESFLCFLDLDCRGVYLADAIWLMILHFPEEIPSLIERYGQKPFIIINRIFNRVENNSETEAKLIALNSNFLGYEQQKRDRNKRALGFNFTNKNFYPAQHIFDCEDMKGETCHHLFKISWTHSNLAHKILLLHKTNPELAEQIAFYAATQRKYSLVWQIMHTIQAHSSSPLANILKECLASGDNNSLTEFARFTDRSISPDVKKRINNFLIIHKNMPPKLVLEELNKVLYTSNRISSFVLPTEKEIEQQLQEIESQTRASSSSLVTQRCMYTSTVVHYIAQQVISEEGEINLQVIPSIINSLNASYLLPNSYIRQIRHVLTYLSKPHFVHLLKKLDARLLTDLNGQFLVRASNDLAYNSPISSAHLMRTILMASLLRARQFKEIGSCEGTSELNVLINHPEKILSILSQLLYRGELTSFDKTESYTIIPSIRPPDKLLSSPLFNEKPTVSELIALPWVSKLQQFLAISSLQKEIWLMKALAMQPDEPLIPKKFIEALVITAKELNPQLANQDNLIDLSEIVFLSAFDSLLTKVLEGFFIGADFWPKHKLNKSLKTILFYLDHPIKEKKELNFFKPKDRFLLQLHTEESSAAYPQSLVNLCQNLSTNQRACFRDVIRAFKKKVSDLLGVAYDFNATNKSENFGTNTFIRRTAMVGSPIRLNSQEAFVKTLTEIAQQVIQEKSAESFLDVDTKQWWPSFSTEFIAYFSSEQFLNALLLLFSPLPKDISPMERNDADFLKHLIPLDRQQNMILPWQLETGAKPTFSKLAIASIEENLALFQCFRICRHAEDIKGLLLEALYTLDPVHSNTKIFSGVIPGHSINYIFDHPFLQPLLASEDKSKWIEDFCVAPAHKAYAEKICSLEDFEALKEKIAAKISIHLSGMWNQLMQTKPLSLSIGDVYKYFRDNLRNFLGSENHNIFIWLDSELLLQWQDYSMHPLPIIDTNWYKDDTQESIYLALVFSPVTLEWELWKMGEEKLIEKETNQFFSLTVPHSIIIS